jgi:hypothetical protein
VIIKPILGGLLWEWTKDCGIEEDQKTFGRHILEWRFLHRAWAVYASLPSSACSPDRFDHPQPCAQRHILLVWRTACADIGLTFIRISGYDSNKAEKYLAYWGPESRWKALIGSRGLLSEKSGGYRWHSVTPRLTRDDLQLPSCRTIFGTSRRTYLTALPQFEVI